MTKLIQICASANDLFGLDGEGVVYQYNFSTNTWMRLGHGRSDRRESSFAEDAIGPPAADATERGFAREGVSRRISQG